MKIHILAENRAQKRGILAEHGLSLWIESGQLNILFDTGQSDVYRKNAEVMGVNLQKTNCIVLSHGHYDHCGGIQMFPDAKGTPSVYLHKKALLKKYHRSPIDGAYRDVGIPWTPEQAGIADSLVPTGESAEIAPGMVLLGEIPVTADFEEPPRCFYTGDEKHPDAMEDEQMLVLRDKDRLTVCLGCSHPGVASCLGHAIKHFPGCRIDTVLGGMHLDGAAPSRIEQTIEAFLRMDIRNVIPLHCTGMLPICRMKQRLASRCRVLCAGDMIDLQ